MNIQDAPYAEWLEDGLRTIFEKNPRAICLIASLEDGTTLTGYYAASAQDKAVFAANVQADYMMDVMTANAQKLKDAIENAEEDDSDGS